MQPPASQPEAHWHAWFLKQFKFFFFLCLFGFFYIYSLKIWINSVCNNTEWYLLWAQFGGSKGQNTFHNPRHFPELKNTFAESKNNSQNPNTLPRIQNIWFWEVFWIMGHVFGFWKVFSWWGQKPPLKCLLRLNLRIFYISFHFLVKLAW